MSELSNQEIKTDLNEAEADLETLNEEQRSELESKSAPFLGQWNRLISTTNWQKGEVIVKWQESMAQSDLPKNSFTDERWSQLCGGATPQHVGRLRRTYSRFGHVFNEYEGLYWSHFFAALDWEDAEMWLEGAIQNDWSVSKMRNSRWETMGQKPADKPRVEQIVVSELEEENQSLGTARINDRDGEFIEGPIPEGPDFGDEPNGDSGPRNKHNDSDGMATAIAEDQGPKIKPFESFSDMPDDIAEAVNAFKIAIIRHKTDDWEKISVEDLHGILDALKALATAASE